MRRARSSMTPTIAIQDVLVPHREIARDIDACRAVGIEPIRFGLIPFSDVISSDDPADLERPAVPFGSTKLVKLWLAGKTPEVWRVYYSAQNFDQRYWLSQIGELALNGPSMARFTELGVIKDTVWKQPVFVKPTDDLKAFAGMVLEAGETIAGRLAQATQDSSLSDTQTVLWAPRQEIVCEYRCYMKAPGQLIDASRYRTGPRADHKPVIREERAILKAFVRRLAERYEPHRFYVVDIGLMPNRSHRVIEYNCINCSGRYESDRGKLFKAVMAVVH